MDNGKGGVRGIKTAQVKWLKDELGRWQMEEIPDSEKIFECDLVLLAMGFLGPEKYISSELDLKLDPRSNYQTAPGKFNTSHPKVFAAGGELVANRGKMVMLSIGRLNIDPIGGIEYVFTASVCRLIQNS